MNKVLYTILGSLLFSMVYFSSCSDDPVSRKVNDDYIAGIYGQVVLYDEYGQEITDRSGITVTADWVDSASVRYDTTHKEAPHGTVITTTAADGWYKFENTYSGLYSLTFTADGFGKNMIYNFDFDSTQADTMDLITMAKSPLGSVEILNISNDESKQVYFFTRKLTFTGSTGMEYGLTTRYFFYTADTVSDHNYLTTVVSGTSVRFGGEEDVMTVRIAVSKIMGSKLKEGQMVYVKAYVDNYYAVSAQEGENSFIYPNLTGGSNVKSFIIDSIPVTNATY